MFTYIYQFIVGIVYQLNCYISIEVEIAHEKCYFLLVKFNTM